MALYVTHSLCMAVEPFGPWPLFPFSFLMLYTVGKTPSMGDQPVARLIPTHKTTQTENKRTQTDIHALSRIRTHDPSVQASQDISCLRPCGHCDGHFTSHIRLYRKVSNRQLKHPDVSILNLFKGRSLCTTT
jgi:hypothetical protein